MNYRNPSQQEIAALADRLWRERGCPEGSSETDWFEAQRILVMNHRAEAPLVRVARDVGWVLGTVVALLNHKGPHEQSPAPKR